MHFLLHSIAFTDNVVSSSGADGPSENISHNLSTGEITLLFTEKAWQVI